MMEPDEYEQSVLQKLESRAVAELKGLFELEYLRRQPEFSEITALLVVLTACNDCDCQKVQNECTQGHCTAAVSKSNRMKEMKSDGPVKEKKCFMDHKFYVYHGQLAELFANSLHLNGNMQRKGNFGRPVFRKVTEALELDGAAGSILTRHLWKLSDSVVLEVPDNCSESFESALLYLLLTVASSSFASHAATRGTVLAMEIPCLFEMFCHSELNNQDCLSALLTEFLALIRVCFFEDYIGDDFSYESCTVNYDFCLKRNLKSICYFSVKTISADAKYFGSLCKEDSLKCYDKFVFEEDEANIFLHSCSCDCCIAQPVRKIEVNREAPYEDELRKVNCSRNDEFSGILIFIDGELARRGLSEAKVVIYLVSARLSNDIRVALGTKEMFCGRNFPLRDFLIGNLKDKFRDSSGKLPCNFGKPRPIRALVDRSN